MKNTCDVCGGPAVARNLCNKHYIRWRRHNDVHAYNNKFSSQLIENLKTHGVIKLLDKNGHLIFIGKCDVEDIPRIKKKEWFFNSKTKQIREKGHGVFLTRYILNIPYKTLNERVVVFKGAHSDYRKQNLRLIPKNSCYKKRVNKNIKYIGVYPTRKKYFSAVTHNGIRYYLGRFSDEHLAARAYNTKVKELYGDIAVLNKIDVKSKNEQ